MPLAAIFSSAKASVSSFPASPTARAACAFQSSASLLACIRRDTAALAHWFITERWSSNSRNLRIIRKHLDAVARRARESGVRTTQVAFHSPRPVKVALEVAQEEQIGLIVFGASRKELGKRYFRKAVKRIRADAPCLVWIDE